MVMNAAYPLLMSDRQTLEAFVDALFRYAEPGTIVSLRSFRHRDDAVIDIRDAIVGPEMPKSIMGTVIAASNYAANYHEPAVFSPPVATFGEKLKIKGGRKVQASNENLACGLSLSVECDTQPAAARAKLEGLLGPATVVVLSGGEWTDPESGEIQPKCHLHWRLTEPTRIEEGRDRLNYARTLASRLVGGDPSGQPIVHPFRWPGSWHRKNTPKLATIETLNESNEIELEDAIELLVEACQAAKIDHPPKGQRGLLGFNAARAGDAKAEDVAAAFALIDNPTTDDNGADWDRWNRLGMAAWRATGGSADGFAAWDAWSAKHDRFDAQTNADRWEHFASSPPTVVGMQTLVYEARKTDAEFMRSKADKAKRFRPANDPLPIDGSEPIEFSEEALALRFTDRHRDRLRHVAAWSRWLVWDGCRWAPDDTMRVLNLSRLVCREASAEAIIVESEKVATRVGSASTVAAVVRLAAADPVHARRSDEWDADQWSLNTPGGIVDLKTGAVRPSDPTAGCTKITAVAPSGECPTWMQFLEDVTARDTDVMDYLQRVIGYCLTGSITEHALFFVHGPGGNGKGVFLNTVQAILGDYATVASMDTFTATPNDRHPADMAMLRGARLVTAQETEEGRRWAESKLKALTGGDPITARFMRQNFFTFHPNFKLFVVGNHRPAIRNVDEAMRRRLHLIPFTYKPPSPDRGLFDRMKDEWPGILRWAIEGCLHWQRIGLNPPGAVLSATAEYFETEDAIGRWIEDQCDRDPTKQTAVSALFADWQAWAGATGEFAGTLKRFSTDVERRGFERVKQRDGNAFRGLTLRDGIRPWYVND
jgi:putative DNA primase/helicase